MPHTIVTSENTAILTLDLQPAIITLSGSPNHVLVNAERAVTRAREKGIKVYHVGTGFDEDYPELRGVTEDLTDKWQPWALWKLIKESRALLIGDPDTDISTVLFQANDVVIWYISYPPNTLVLNYT
jgi:nicotinamidase-related amidase